MIRKRWLVRSPTLSGQPFLFPKKLIVLTVSPKNQDLLLAEPHSPARPLHPIKPDARLFRVIGSGEFLHPITIEKNGPNERCCQVVSVCSSEKAQLSQKTVTLLLLMRMRHAPAKVSHLTTKFSTNWSANNLYLDAAENRARAAR